LPPKQIELRRPAWELIEKRCWERVCDCHCVSASRGDSTPDCVHAHFLAPSQKGNA
jgi:hypothetical protein